MRRSTGRLVALLAVTLALGLLAGCSGDDGGSDASKPARTTTTTATSGTEEQASTTTSSTVPAADPATLCEPFLSLRVLRAALPGIAEGSRDGQVAADAQQQAAVDELRAGSGGAKELEEALDTIEASSFLVTASTSGPSADEVTAALAVLEFTYAPACVPAVTTTTVAPTTAPPVTKPPIPCPSQQDLDAQGLSCDADGRLYAVGESPTTLPPEAPSPCPPAGELAAEGLTCDANGEIHANEGDDFQY